MRRLVIGFVLAMLGAVTLHAFVPGGGVLTPGPVYQVSAGWTSMVPVPHGDGAYTLFFYNAATGALAVAYLQQWDPGCPTPTPQCVP